MKKILSAMALLLPVSAVAGLGADSSFGELYQSNFHRPLTQTIPFYAKSSNGEGSKLVMAKVHDVSYFKDADGKLMLYAGQTQVCNRFVPTGSIGDSHRLCLSKETVQLVRPAAYAFKYCVFRTDDDCGKYVKADRSYPLQYQVPVIKRASVSDSFSYGNVAFYKPVQLPLCKQCANLSY